MLKNLLAELAKERIPHKAVACEINVTDRTLRNKILSGHISMSEGTKLRDKFFPHLSLEYLYQNFPEEK